MNPMQAIRLHVFRITQADMAVIAKVRQSVVSRWERGELEPRLSDLARIRAAAAARGLRWEDGWFFEAPEAPEEAA
jgi:predicted transcriptional regulator